MNTKQNNLIGFSLLFVVFSVAGIGGYFIRDWRYDRQFLKKSQIIICEELPTSLEKVNEKCKIQEEGMDINNALPLNQDRIDIALKSYELRTNGKPDLLGMMSFLLAILGFAIGLQQYIQDSEKTRKKEAHNLVLKFLKNVYEVRQKLGNKIYVYASHPNYLSIPEEDENHIKYILNNIEEICIAAKEGVIDEKLIIDNCISIIIEYHVLLKDYILYKVEVDSIKKIEELDSWGVSVNKIEKWKTKNKIYKLFTEIKNDAKNKTEGLTTFIIKIKYNSNIGSSSIKKLNRRIRNLKNQTWNSLGVYSQIFKNDNNNKELFFVAYFHDVADKNEYISNSVYKAFKKTIQEMNNKINSPSNPIDINELNPFDHKDKLIAKQKLMINENTVSVWDR